VNEEGRHPLFDAIESADLAAITQLASLEADLNTRDRVGDPALFTAVTGAEFAQDDDDYERRLEVIRRMVDLGADLDALGPDGGSILIAPILGLRTGLVEWLLERGVDSNHGCGEPWETIYDLASFDYDYEAWRAPSLPALAPPGDLIGEDAVLTWLDQEAEARGYLQPTILLLLRRFGALTGSEMAVRLGGRSTDLIRWTDGGWILAS
jgi:hypothetical protein